MTLVLKKGRDGYITSRPDIYGNSYGTYCKTQEDLFEHIKNLLDEKRINGVQIHECYLFEHKDKNNDKKDDK